MDYIVHGILARPEYWRGWPFPSLLIYVPSVFKLTFILKAAQLVKSQAFFLTIYLHAVLLIPSFIYISTFLNLKSLYM